ncbi:MAG TPA: COQ9 family protein [Acidocella sp.]|nr:COQ9 family protein [Acidocella sp.]
MQPDAQTAAVLDALLPEIPFEGWTQAALRNALRTLGRPPEDAALLFPGGAGEMIEACFALANSRMAEVAAATPQPERLSARVRAAAALWFAQNHTHKEALRRALAWLSFPTHASIAARIMAACVDAIWRAAGDTSADFAWYTKRATLAGIFGSTMLYWLQNTSPDDADTLAFLDRRLANAASLTKTRKRLEAKFSLLGRRGAEQ